MAVGAARSTSACRATAAWADDRPDLDRQSAGRRRRSRSTSSDWPATRCPTAATTAAGSRRSTPSPARTSTAGPSVLGHDIADGQFGENLTTVGIDVNEAELGERWRIGDTVVLEVASIRTPCNDFKAWLGLCGYDETAWVKRFAAECRPGPYLRVLSPGTIRAGDPIEVDSRARSRRHGVAGVPRVPARPHAAAAAGRRRGAHAEDPGPASTTTSPPPGEGRARSPGCCPTTPPSAGWRSPPWSTPPATASSTRSRRCTSRGSSGSRWCRSAPASRSRRAWRSWPASRSGTSPTGSARARCRWPLVGSIAVVGALFLLVQEWWQFVLLATVVAVLDRGSAAVRSAMIAGLVRGSAPVLHQGLPALDHQRRHDHRRRHRRARAARRHQERLPDRALRRRRHLRPHRGAGGRAAAHPPDAARGGAPHDRGAARPAVRRRRGRERGAHHALLDPRDRGAAVGGRAHRGPARPGGGAPRHQHRGRGAGPGRRGPPGRDASAPPSAPPSSPGCCSSWRARCSAPPRGCRRRWRRWCSCSPRWWRSPASWLRPRRRSCWPSSCRPTTRWASTRACGASGSRWRRSSHPR